MRKHLSLLARVWAAIGLGIAVGLSIPADETRADDQPRVSALKTDRDTIVREILVPFDALPVVLPKDAGRVMLSRDEYENLLKKAARTPPEAAPPCQAAILAADYTASIAHQRAEMVGRLIVEVLADGLHAVPLDLGGVGLRSALLDGRAASLGRRDGEPLRFFVEGRGRHELKLEMVAPVETTAACQTLHFRLPATPAGRLRLTVPGDVEIKGGAAVVTRELDRAAGLTRFELLPHAGDTSVVMSLNSHLYRQQRAVVARSVFINEVTQAYQRLHATLYLEILHQAVDRFQFAVPDGFEVTEVVSPMLARWAVEKQTGRQVLEVRLRQPSTEAVVLNVVAYRVGALRGSWSLARVKPLDVVSEASVFGLLVEERLKAESLQPKDLIPIDTALLTRVLPASVFQAEPGAPTLVPVVAYYAPQADFGLSARLVEPPAKVKATTSMLLVLTDQGQQVVGRMSLRPEAEKLFHFELFVPAGWQITSLTNRKTVLKQERYETTGGTRLRVALPKGVAVDNDCPIEWNATRTPPGWLGEWTSMAIDFPRFTVIGTEQVAACIAVDARDDMIVRPDELSDLTSLDDAAKTAYGLAGVISSLAYRCESPKFQATLQVERAKPRLTARTLSFVRVEPDALTVHDELIYTIENARTRHVSLLLPESTPTALSIRGLDGLRLKEYGSQPASQGLRRWTVQLEEARLGQVRIAVDFHQPLGQAKPKNLALPIVRADGVAYQSGLLAVEGSAELDVRIEAGGARRVDVGELADAEYQPGRRLLGAFGFAGDQSESKVDVRVSVTRHPGYPLPPAIVQHAELTTLMSAEGQCVTNARFGLRAKAALVDVTLPDGATLWSATVDGKPVKPNREGNAVLVSLPPDERPCELQLVYAAAVNPVKVSGVVRLTPPGLVLRSDRHATGVAVPLADLAWRVQLPCEYEVVHTAGTLITHDVQPPEPAAITVAKGLFVLAGGISGPPNLVCAVRSRAQHAASKSAQTGPTTWSKDDVGYAPPSAPSVAGAAGSPLTNALTDKQPAAPRRSVESSIDTSAMKDAKDPFASPIPVAATAPRKAAAVGTDDRKEPVDALIEKKGERETIGARIEGGAGAAYGRRGAPRQSVLAGVRSLVIDVQDDPGTHGRTISFHSLGVEPRLEMTLVHHARFGALEWAIALLVGFLGIVRTNRPMMAKARFLVIVGLWAGVLPLVVNQTQLVESANMVFFVVTFLVPYYLLAGLLRWLASGLRRMTASLIKATAMAVLLTVATVGPQVLAADTPYVVEIVDPNTRVSIPADAILRPYDPKSPHGVQEAKNLLIPYARYVELWNRANPDKKIDSHKAPADYALAGAVYRATLEGDESLRFSGTLEFDVYQDGYVSIPLALKGGILARADVDGQAARLGSMPVASPSGVKTAAPVDGTKPLIVLHTSGKGRHRLELEIRMSLERRGGWRVTEGILPSAPAAAVSLMVPKTQTEVRLTQVSDRLTQETEKPNEAIETSLGPGGTIGIQWRPKVAEGLVDQSLSAHSTATLDVQEDGLHMGWQLGLEFRRSQRETFRLTVPMDCLVERIEGSNVRGWESRTVDGRQRVDVALLKAARDTEGFVVWLARRGAVIKGELAEFSVPTVAVDGAALHDGRLTIRRSPRLDLRTLDIGGASRTDLQTDTSGSTAAIDPKRCPFGLRPFQAYQFVGNPPAIRLSAHPLSARASAQVQTVLRISPYERSLETLAKLNIEDRPVHQVEILIPKDLELRSVSTMGEYHWAVASRDGRRLLTVYLAAGRTGEVPVVLQGRLGKTGLLAEVSLPRLDVLGVDRQQGDIAVQADSAFELTTVGLQGCQSVLRDQVFPWLKPEQRAATQLALSYRDPDYSGTVRVVPRKADVSCSTITNVRVTSRAVEETILLDYNVRNAGIHELSFLLPVGKEEPRIQAVSVRQKNVARIDTPHGPRLRVHLDFQQDVMGELRILVYNDRALTGDAVAAAIPTIEGVRVDQQFVALESSGRDEVLVDTREGMERLDEQQKQWQTIRGRIGGPLHQAYLVTAGVAQPRLVFHTRERETVQTAGARIGLAETHVVLDDHGAYRAQAVYFVDNLTEQFLEIDLPEGAILWTAQVAGEPVKPVRDPAPASSGRLRIPLVKTAPGDVDYRVVLTYGGAIPAPGLLKHVEFPLLKTAKVNAALSHVWLHLPGTRQWFNFGGKMRLVTADETVANEVAYNTTLSQRLLDTMRHGDEFAKVRAANNLKQLGAVASSYRISGKLGDAELNRNKAVYRQTQQEVAQFEAQARTADDKDNRERLNDLYSSQVNRMTGNAALTLGGNFGSAPTAESTERRDSNGFNADWFASNGLTAATLHTSTLSDDSGRKPAAQPPASQTDRLRVRSPSPRSAIKEEAEAGFAFQGKLEGITKSGSGTLTVDDRSQANDPFGRPRRSDVASVANASGSQQEQQTLARYQKRLAQQQTPSEMKGNLPSQDRGGKVMLGVGVNSDSGLVEQVAPENASRGQGTVVLNGGMLSLPSVATPPTVSPAMGEKDKGAAGTGLASLEIDLPKLGDGVVYAFTTPQGDVEINAWAASQDATRGVIGGLGTMAGLALAWLVLRAIGHGWFAWLGSRSGSWLMILGGVAAMLFGVLPVLGFFAVIAGIISKIWPLRLAIAQNC